MLDQLDNESLDEDDEGCSYRSQTQSLSFENESDIERPRSTKEPFQIKQTEKK